MRQLNNCFCNTGNCILLVVCFTSCTHYYYGPNSGNIPLFQEKDEARISVGVSGADETTGFELQSAYAFGKNFGAMFNFYATGGKENTSTNSSSGSGSATEKGNGTLTEIGFGYFSSPSPSKLIFEIYGGIGGGTVNNTYQTNERSRVGLTKLFLQPSLGYSNDQRTLEVAFSTRFSSVAFKVKEKRFSTGTDNYNLEQVNDIEKNDNIPFFEPSFVIRGGGKNVKAQIQLTTSHALKDKAFLTQSSNLSFGVLFSFSGKATK